MAALKIWGTIEAAAADIRADRKVAARLCFVFVGVTLLLMLPPLLPALLPTLPLLPLLSVLPLLGHIALTAWIVQRWAAAVRWRATGIPLDGDFFWPVFAALMKLYLVLLVVWVAGVSLELAAVGLMRLSAPVGVLAALIGLALHGGGIIVGIRLSLLPFRAAIGEGSAVHAAWGASRGHAWGLCGLTALLLLGVVIASLLLLTLFSVIAGVALQSGWIAPPVSMTNLAVAQWLRLPATRLLLALTELMFSPAAGLFYLLATGVFTRAALPRASVQGMRDNPWAV